MSRRHTYQELQQAIKKLRTTSPEVARSAERLLELLERYRQQNEPVSPTALSNNPRYRALLHAWRRALLDEEPDWDSLWALHKWLRLSELAAGLKEDE